LLGAKLLSGGGGGRTNGGWGGFGPLTFNSLLLEFYKVYGYKALIFFQIVFYEQLRLHMFCKVHKRFEKTITVALYENQ
jgi:hypothetical protein